MRLGLLGPAVDQKDALRRAAQKMQEELGADRVLYLGSDRMLDVVISEWAVELVGPKADDFSVMTRATDKCLGGTPEAVDKFVARERQRSSLRMFESLPGERTRSVDLVGGKVAVMLYDKAQLEEEDILPATLLIFGKSREPLIKLIGRRWFLSPGSFPKAGVMVVDDADERLRAISYNADFGVISSTTLVSPKTLRMHVSGDS